MSEVKSLIAEIKSKGLLRAGDKLELLYVVAAQLQDDFASLKAERDAMAAETNWWKPERCPVTNRAFFLWIEHPSGGMVPTYGGPYDSYTIPNVDSDGEFCCERYDHDEGAWVDSECLSVRLTDDREPAVDYAFLNSVRAEGVEAFAHQQRVIADSLSGDEQRSHRITACRAEDFANQLRAGETS